MRNNILRLGQLLERGNDVQMKNLELSVRDKNNSLIARVKIIKKLAQMSIMACHIKAQF